MKSNNTVKRPIKPVKLKKPKTPIGERAHIISQRIYPTNLNAFVKELVPDDKDNFDLMLIKGIKVEYNTYTGNLSIYIEKPSSKEMWEKYDEELIHYNNNICENDKEIARYKEEKAHYDAIMTGKRLLTQKKKIEEELMKVDQKLQKIGKF